MGRIIVVSGPSGSGKTTILRRLLAESEIHFSVSATTRAPRPDETPGVDYDFISTEDFEELIANDELLEWAVYNNNYYGTPERKVEEVLATGQSVLLDIEIQGVRQIRLRRPDALMFFITPPSIEILESRLRARGDTSESDIRERMEIARTQMAEAVDLFDHIVVNDDLDRAVEEVRDLVTRGTSGNLEPTPPNRFIHED